MGFLRIDDGDTGLFQFDDGSIDSVRTAAANAPELSHSPLYNDVPGAEEAKQRYAQLVDTPNVTVEPLGRDLYGRVKGVVRADGVDTGEALVRSGHAFATNYSDTPNAPDYTGAQLAALRDAQDPNSDVARHWATTQMAPGQIPIYQKPGQGSRSLWGEFKAGVSRGVDQLQGLAYDAGKWGGQALSDVTGLDTSGFQQAMDEGATRNRFEASLNPASVPTIHDIHGIGDTAQWAVGSLGEQVPMAAAMAVPGLGANAVAGRAAGWAGAALGAFVPNVGESQAEMDQTGEQHPWRVAATGAAKTAGDLASAYLGIDALGALKGGKLATNVAKGLLADIPGEGLTEGAQNLADQAMVRTTDKFKDTPYDWGAALNDAAVGAVAGGAFGAASGGAKSFMASSEERMIDALKDYKQFQDGEVVIGSDDPKVVAAAVDQHFTLDDAAAYLQAKPEFAQRLVDRAFADPTGEVDILKAAPTDLEVTQLAHQMITQQAKEQLAGQDVQRQEVFDMILPPQQPFAFEPDNTMDPKLVEAVTGGGGSGGKAKSDEEILGPAPTDPEEAKVYEAKLKELQDVRNAYRQQQIDYHQGVAGTPQDYEGWGVLSHRTQGTSPLKEVPQGAEAALRYVEETKLRGQTPQTEVVAALLAKSKVADPDNALAEQLATTSYAPAHASTPVTPQQLASKEYIEKAKRTFAPVADQIKVEDDTLVIPPTLSDAQHTAATALLRVPTTPEITETAQPDGTTQRNVTFDPDGTTRIRLEPTEAERVQGLLSTPEGGLEPGWRQVQPLEGAAVTDPTDQEAVVKGLSEALLGGAPTGAATPSASVAAATPSAPSASPALTTGPVEKPSTVESIKAEFDASPYADTLHKLVNLSDEARVDNGQPVAGVFEGGKVNVYAPHIEQGEAVSKAAHEITHGFMKSVVGAPIWNTILGQIKNDRVGSQVWNQVAEDYKGHFDPEGKGIDFTQDPKFHEEVLAHLVEQGDYSNKGWFKNLVQAIKSWWSKQKATRGMKLTDQDFVNLAHLTLKNAGKAKAVSTEGVRYSLVSKTKKNPAYSDQEYFDAIARGDKEAVQRMVTEKAKTSGVPVLDEHGVTAYTARRSPPPKKTTKAYKLFRVKRNSKGEVFALFVGSKDPLPQGVWLDALAGPPVAVNGNTKVKSTLGPLAYRPGWHAGDIPLATHIGAMDREGNIIARKEDEVWAEVEMADDMGSKYQDEATRNGTTEDGRFIEALADIKYMPENGLYRYKTNANMTGNWIISSSMKINKILSEEEVNSILKENNAKVMPWAKEYKPTTKQEKADYERDLEAAKTAYANKMSSYDKDIASLKGAREQELERIKSELGALEQEKKSLAPKLRKPVVDRINELKAKRSGVRDQYKAQIDELEERKETEKVRSWKLWETTNLDLDKWSLKTDPAVNRKKLLDPVTYDDAGNVIPLSQRFDKANPDPRYSLVSKSKAKLNQAKEKLTPSKALEDTARFGLSWITPVNTWMHSLRSPTMARLMESIHHTPGTKGKNPQTVEEQMMDEGHYDAVKQDLFKAMWAGIGEYERLLGTSKKVKERQKKIDQFGLLLNKQFPASAYTDPQMKQWHAKYRKIMDKIFDKMEDAGMRIGRLEDYSPLIVDQAKWLDNKDTIIGLIESEFSQGKNKDEGFSREQAEKLWLAVSESSWNLVDLEMDKVWAPAFSSRKSRTMPKELTEKLAPYMINDPGQVMSAYIHAALKRLAWEREFNLTSFANLGEFTIDGKTVDDSKSSARERAYKVDEARHAVRHASEDERDALFEKQYNKLVNRSHTLSTMLEKLGADPDRAAKVAAQLKKVLQQDEVVAAFQTAIRYSALPIAPHKIIDPFKTLLDAWMESDLATVNAAKPADTHPEVWQRLVRQEIVGKVSDYFSYEAAGRINALLDDAAQAQEITLDQAKYIKDVIFPALQGRYGSSMPLNVRWALGVAQAYLNTVFLPLSAFSNVVELANLDIRSQRLGEWVRQGMRLLRDKRFRDQMEILPRHLGLLRMDAIEYTLNTVHEAYAFTGSKSAKLNHYFFKANGTQWITNMTRKLAVASGTHMFQEIGAANQLAPWMQRELEEAGVTHEQVKTWANQFGSADFSNYDQFETSISRLDRDTQLTVDAVNNAILRYAMGAVLMPQASTRPAVMSHHVGSVVLGMIASFQFYFMETIWPRIFHQTKDSAGLMKAMPAIRMVMAMMPLMAVGLLAREAIKAGLSGDDKKFQKWEEDPSAFWVDVLHRSGMLGYGESVWRAKQAMDRPSALVIAELMGGAIMVTEAERALHQNMPRFVSTHLPVLSSTQAFQIPKKIEEEMNSWGLFEDMDEE